MAVRWGTVLHTLFFTFQLPSNGREKRIVEEMWGCAENKFQTNEYCQGLKGPNFQWCRKECALPTAVNNNFPRAVCTSFPFFFLSLPFFFFCWFCSETLLRFFFFFFTFFPFVVCRVEKFWLWHMCGRAGEDWPRERALGYLVSLHWSGGSFREGTKLNFATVWVEKVLKWKE